LVGDGFDIISVNGQELSRLFVIFGIFEIVDLLIVADNMPFRQLPN